MVDGGTGDRRHEHHFSINSLLGVGNVLCQKKVLQSTLIYHANVTCYQAGNLQIFAMGQHLPGLK